MENDKPNNIRTRLIRNYKITMAGSDVENRISIQDRLNPIKVHFFDKKGEFATTSRGVFGHEETRAPNHECLLRYYSGLIKRLPEKLSSKSFLDDKSVFGEDIGTPRQVITAYLELKETSYEI